MNEKYLTLKQNTCAARVFLNTFGLILENVSDVNEFSNIKIFDNDNNEVGVLYFDNGRVIMKANYNDSMLEANFDIAKMVGFVDVESNSGVALFGQWSSKIDFQLHRHDNVKMFGEFLVESCADTEFGLNCLCHPLINCDVPGLGRVNLKILRDGSTFSLNINSEDNYEVIDISPWDWLNGFFLHEIKRGKYDEENYVYPYRKYAGIFNVAEVGENKNKLHVFLTEEEFGNQLDFKNEFPQKVGDENSEESLLQKGLLMKKLDSDMFDRIEDLKKLFLIGDISLLDRLVSVCYDSYSNEELKALLGIERQQMNYQDGSDNLINSYFGIGGNSCFISLNEQKKLLKRKNEI